MKLRGIPFITLLLVFLSACGDFDAQAYVPGIETKTPVQTQGTSMSLSVSSEEPSATYVPTDAPTLKVCTNIVGGKLHVRFEPGTSSDVRGYLTEGEIVTIGKERQKQDGVVWIKISHPIEGWVNVSFLCSGN